MAESLSLLIVGALFDRMEWVNRRLLEGAQQLSREQWVAASGVTTRDLRGTLVHELDVEWSWRIRLAGRDEEAWNPGAELRPESFPTAAHLATRWERDEAELRAWLATLTEADLLAPPATASGRQARPLWHYLMHILSHSTQQQADAATLLTMAGQSPGDIDFLDYISALEG